MAQGGEEQYQQLAPWRCETSRIAELWCWESETCPERMLKLFGSMQYKVFLDPTEDCIHHEASAKLEVRLARLQQPFVASPFALTRSLLQKYQQ